jgi:tRNA(Ile2) C34 agmatinyltransferase TiaS
MKLKHNKKRNTAFLYETLVKELTAAVVEQDTNRKNAIVSIVKEFFSKGSILKRELDLYKALNETHKLDVYTAERLIAESKKQFAELDRKVVFNTQTALIESINKIVGQTAFSNFIPNYKTLASIAQIFQDSLPAKEKVLLERKVIGRLVAKPTSEAPQDDRLEHIDNLVFKKVIENFNKKYNGQLLAEQRDLLNRYIVSFSDSDVEFKVYVNEELGRIKENLSILREDKDIKADGQMLNRVSQLEEVVGRFQTRKIDTDMIEKIMSIQSLIAECSKE